MDINLLGFMPALLPVALSPGASFTLVMSGALAGGHKGLFRTLAGTALGIYTHAVLIGFGITAVLISSPASFAVLKFFGTAYLLWLGAMLIRNGIRANPEGFADTKHSVTLRAAWIANVLNPKAIIFYLTVVSQFAGIQGGVGNYLTLASVHVVVMSVWLYAVSQTLIFSVKKTNPLMLKKYVNIAGGMLLIAFSLHSLIP
ncbi:lysine transporter LysE [bacteria symbiont BFo1 of Frankliniella occidentalis]|jgi:threonine/homoserine/homoserine lactone efflux protein|uniref:LysE family translocator n=1 Tax=Erwinia aphidicola TaxID=68334 RepID=A0ABU8DBB8_ERWAP|nr:LysE family translocator [Erwinia aphidicola]KMV69335.1 lysine transporter LysE [bacteria symbiont BFo1 of Frankliniella occidentalis]PIJ55914.1 lysine transporter LysE [Erwinia sp. OLMDLW33]KYP84102.1 lysine transporter LysE [bacteria symbiont BFo1 of Frankliniella occidentalis]KYP89481.1 lysine transporter LysE [bacteria symbiont BFo1 of Frankliniella occidentalis]MBD1376889.1 LysE family translocator [Erwinia aphidicola]